MPAGAAKYAQRGTSGSFLAVRNLLGFTAGSLLAQGQLPALCGKGDNSMGGRPHERSPNKRAAQHLLRAAEDPAHPTIAEALESLAQAHGSPGQAKNIQRQVRERHRKALTAATAARTTAAQPGAKAKLKLGGKGSRKNQNQRAHAARETKAFEQLQQEAFQEAVREYRTQWELQQMGGKAKTPADVIDRVLTQKRFKEVPYLRQAIKPNTVQISLFYLSTQPQLRSSNSQKL